MHPLLHLRLGREIVAAAAVAAENYVVDNSTAVGNRQQKEHRHRCPFPVALDAKCCCNHLRKHRPSPNSWIPKIAAAADAGVPLLLRLQVRYRYLELKKMWSVAACRYSYGGDDDEGSS